VTFLHRVLLAAILSAAELFATGVYAQDEAPVVVKDFDVYVDLPTAFAFVKLSKGWKFIGKLDADQLRHLPAGTVTSLLPGSGSDSEPQAHVMAESNGSARRNKARTQ